MQTGEGKTLVATLPREVLHAQHTPCGFAADGKGIRQDVIQRFALGQLLLKGGSLRL